jgi:hypothetical protein
VFYGRYAIPYEVRGGLFTRLRYVPTSPPPPEFTELRIFFDAIHNRTLRAATERYKEQITKRAQYVEKIRGGFFKN